MRIRVTTRADLFEKRKQQHIERGYRIEDERPIPVNGLCSFIAVSEIPDSDGVGDARGTGAQWDGEMRPHGKTKLGFFPLPVPEAERLKNWLAFASEFSALDPCVGDGVAFTHLLHGVTAHRYGIEIDANRAEQARALGIETLQANAMDVRCPPEAVSLLYLNPSVRLGIRGEQQPEIGIGLPGTHLSLAQSRWCAAIRDSAAAIGEMCQIAKRTFHGFASVQAHRAGLPAIQADRSACNAPQTALQGY